MFNIMSMVADTLTVKRGLYYTPILPIKVFVRKIKGAAHKNGDVDGTYKESLIWYSIIWIWLTFISEFSELFICAQFMYKKSFNVSFLLISIHC